LLISIKHSKFLTLKNIHSAAFKEKKSHFSPKSSAPKPASRDHRSQLASLSSFSASLLHLLLIESSDGQTV
ncbi:hypothetical protein BgiMline_031780, partial [Biomphalaria glabrata]